MRSAGIHPDRLVSLHKAFGLEDCVMNRLSRIWLTAFCMLVLAMPLLVAVAQARPAGAMP
jgi:hypothetical protein